jgi:hypothetical protein
MNDSLLVIIKYSIFVVIVQNIYKNKQKNMHDVSTQTVETQTVETHNVETQTDNDSNSQTVEAEYSGTVSPKFIPESIIPLQTFINTAKRLLLQNHSTV